MKLKILWAAMLLLAAFVGRTQSFCYAYKIDQSVNYSYKIYVTNVFDGDDYEGGTDNYSGIKYSITKAVNKTWEKIWGGQFNIPIGKADIITKDEDGAFADSYKASLSRKRLINKYKEMNYQVIEVQAEY